MLTKLRATIDKLKCHFINSHWAVPLPGHGNTHVRLSAHSFLCREPFLHGKPDHLHLVACVYVRGRCWVILENCVPAMLRVWCPFLHFGDLNSPIQGLRNAFFFSWTLVKDGFFFCNHKSHYIMTKSSNACEYLVGWHSSDTTEHLTHTSCCTTLIFTSLRFRGDSSKAPFTWSKSLLSLSEW